MTTDPNSNNNSNNSGKKKNFVGGNWKCNLNNASVTALCEGLLKSAVGASVDVIVAPISIHIPLVQQLLSKSGYQIASQNVSRTATGAFTGEICAQQLTDFQLRWTIVGHSERRKMFGDTDEIVADKMKISLANKLKVIACFGEQLADRENGNVNEVCTRQLNGIISGVENVEDWDNVVLAYEPVWAIGTGKACDPKTAQETIKMCRDHLSKAVSAEIANCVRIVYGGSVKPANCEQLIKEQDIDGFLVGGASLKPDMFSVIIKSAL